MDSARVADDMREDFDEVLHTNDFLSVRRRAGWFYYLHEDRCGGQIVAVLIFERNHDTGHRILGRWENNPAHKPGLSLLSLTGGVENGMSLDEVAIMEIKEESGIFLRGGAGALIRLGTVRPYKAADTVVTLYAVDGSGYAPEKTEGDGSAGEKDAFCEWMPARRAAACDDPLVAAMIVRLNLYTGIDLLEKGEWA